MEQIVKNRTIDLKVKEIIMDMLGIEGSLLIDQAHFSEDLAIDSLDFYELLTGLEKEFSIRIPDEDIEKLASVGSLITYIKNKKLMGKMASFHPI